MVAWVSWDECVEHPPTTQPSKRKHPHGTSLHLRDPQSVLRCSRIVTHSVGPMSGGLRALRTYTSCANDMSHVNCRTYCYQACLLKCRQVCFFALCSPTH